MIRLIAFLLSLFLFLACSQKTNSLFISNSDGLIKQELIAKPDCNDPLSYAPDTFTNMKYIRVCVHILDDTKNSANFSLEEGKKFMYYLIKDANSKLSENRKMNLPEGNTTEALDPGYRYKVVPATNQPGDDGYYKHQDDELAYFVGKGRDRNNYSTDVIKKYQIGQDSIINIFVLPHHPDSVKSKTYKPLGGGIALGTALKMSGLYNNDRKSWSYSTLLNHEIGHILGLSHSWIRNDRCDDTPQHPNCWDHNSPACKGTLASNNMMDYNNSQMAITPCQLGIIHKGLSKQNARNRKLLINDWCTLDDSKEININSTIQWTGARDINHNIVIQEGGTLELNCRLSMAAGSSIKVMPKGKLILNNTRLHNDCNYNWDGIEVVSVGKESGEVISYGDPIIENVTN